MKQFILILMACFIFVPTAFAQESENKSVSDANKVLWEIRMNPEDSSRHSVQP